MLYFTGDINYCDGYFDAGIGTGSKVKQGMNPLQHLPHKDEDFWIGNFEGVCSNASALEGVARKQFKIEPKYLKGLWHPNVYAVANNHVMQHGTEAYIEMLSNIKSLNSKYVGSDARRSVWFEHQGKSVALTAFNQRPENFKFGTLYWANPEYSEIEEEYKKNVSDADFKVVYVHWGNEFMNHPYIDQRKFAHWLIDLGYDLIVGMHPHILQGFEVYKDKYIFYSLGNTVFDMAWYKTRYGALVKADLSGDKPTVGYDYIEIDKEFAPHVVTEDKVPEDCRFGYLNTLVGHNNENEKYYAELFRLMKQYRKANYKKIAKDMFRMKPSVLFSIFSSFVKRKLKSIVR